MDTDKQKFLYVCLSCGKPNNDFEHCCDACQAEADAEEGLTD